jgi:DMSO reductase anchor subunit
MHPAPSVISFTTLLGAAQGLVVAAGIATLNGTEIPHLAALLWIAVVMLVISLGASFFHLGHPERAWRAMAMWRTSWLSREVIVLPVFISLTGLWAILATIGHSPRWLIVLLLALAALLWICTAMIYACLKFIQEWAHPLTLINYTLLGLASGVVLLCSLLALLAPGSQLLAVATPWAIALTVVALGSRAMSLQRNASLRPASTLQSATGIRQGCVRQISMGMSAGAFNTREFFHGRGSFFVRHVRTLMFVLCFAAPVIALVAAARSDAAWLAALAFPLQYAGLLAERWLFFAQARHPQNLYYQTVS